ncbi:MAG: glycoside hydrolase family 76 protein [Ferruginibacter sp.]
MEKDEKPFSYLWPLCALVQAANEMEAFLPGTTYLQAPVRTINKYYSTRPPHAGYDSYVVENGGGDRFYDDNQWIGIAYMDAYNRTRDTQYLTRSKDIYDFMMTGFDMASGGGIYWKEFDKSTKNTCSNGPGILLALQLYQATNQRQYLDTALLLYAWTTKNLLSPEGLYFDAIQLPSGKIDKRIYTYNTGTMLQGNVLLYKITRDKQYLEAARQLADRSLDYFFKEETFPENHWFNAVLLRGYEALFRVDNEKKYINAFVTYANKIWQSQTDVNKLIGLKKNKSLIDQAGYLEIIARLAKYD